VNLHLLRIVCGITVEWRGLDKIPAGAFLVAAKHQSVWETFALLTLFRDPTYILKRELLWLPLFGWAAWRAGMIPVDRGGGKPALAAMAACVRDALAAGKQIIIFPEGTRRPPGAPPDYQSGIALLYRTLGVPVVPVALNSGLYWPKKSFLHYPGTIVVQFLAAIPPGLDSRAFLAALEKSLETASSRLVLEAVEGRPIPAATPENSRF
jgi:1-acyl-sn-glycerol-3-phosphate acyltransferase